MLRLQASLFSHLFSLHISGCPCSPPGSAPETLVGPRAPDWTPPYPPAVGAGGGNPGPWWICQRSSWCSWWGFPRPPTGTAWSAPLHFWLAAGLENMMDPWNLFVCLGWFLLRIKHFTDTSSLTSVSWLFCTDLDFYHSNKQNPVWTGGLLFLSASGINNLSHQQFFYLRFSR